MTAQLNFDNIQGDVLQGLPKMVQSNLFFVITDAQNFQKQFKAVIPLITTTTQALADQDEISAHKSSGAVGYLPIVGTNVAFSSSGLAALNINDELNDPLFKSGQRADAFALSDPGTGDATSFDPDWEPEFKQTIHGCFIITGDSTKTIDARITELQVILGTTIQFLAKIDGAVRPDEQRGHEHFGFKDGISNPPVIGFREPHAGEAPTQPGRILLGEDGDDDGNQTTPTVVQRPAWAKDGSFLVFRKLQQFVPEFNNFLAQNPIAGMPADQGSELLGAKMVGRWKSGAPMDRDPLHDSSTDANNVDLVNNFDYSGDKQGAFGANCPVTAHLRKMNPRASQAGLGPGLAGVQVRRIVRQGIPYGPEVDPQEAASGKTIQDRGLLFLCYQSNVKQGFHFLQQTWANNKNFPRSSTEFVDGFDPIIGQSLTEPRFMTGDDPKNLMGSLNLPDQDFVVPRGGEYFFSPPISALKTKIASA